LQWHREKAGTIEAVHDVLKNELSAGVLPCGRFGANAAWLRLAVLTYNTLTALKRLALPAELLQARPKRLRSLFFNTAGRFVQHARKTILRLAMSATRLAEFLSALIALDLIGKGTPQHQSSVSGGASNVSGGQIDTASIAKLVGHEGEQTGQVYKITIGRDDINLKEMGAPINARMGLNTWAAFFGSDANAEIAGDVAMLANEVTPVLKALRGNGLNVVAIHNHMIGGATMVYFLHYWGTGPAEKLANGFKSALTELGKVGAAHTGH
jgi:hypothetical protein